MDRAQLLAHLDAAIDGVDIGPWQRTRRVREHIRQAIHEAIQELALAEPPADTPKLPPPEWWRARGEHPPVDDNEARARYARLAEPPADTPASQTACADCERLGVPCGLHTAWHGKLGSYHCDSPMQSHDD